MEDERLQNLALAMAVTCVRNTVIESYHAAGKITDPEMAAFNREVADKLYTFLRIMFGDPKDYEDFMRVVGQNHPRGWDKPKKNEGMVKSLKMYRERAKNDGK